MGGLENTGWGKKVRVDGNMLQDKGGGGTAKKEPLAIAGGESGENSPKNSGGAFRKSLIK